MNIRLAIKNDLSELKYLFKEVVDDLNNVKKINMLWDNIYPFCELEKDIERQEMYVIEEANKILGSFVLSNYDDPEYHVIEWASDNKRWFYLNRLVILPTKQGKGYAKQAMQFIFQYSIDNNYETIRLTVHKDNLYAINLYEKYGFIKVKNGYWTLDNEIFYGFEKNI